MADLKPFAGLSSDETAQTMLYLLAAILEKLPRLDANDRLIVNPSEIAPATTPVSGSLNAVATVTDLTRINSFGTSATTARPADAMPIHMGNAGSAHIYNNILVS